MSLTIYIVCAGELRTKQQSRQLKDDGIVIFALGIGSNVHAAELKALASDESYVFRFTSVRAMSPKDNALKIALALCSGKQEKQQVVSYQTSGTSLPFLGIDLFTCPDLKKGNRL